MTTPTKETKQATPRPWRVAFKGKALVASDYGNVALACRPMTKRNVEATHNASLIVRAVNEHEALCAVAEAAAHAQDLVARSHDAEGLEADDRIGLQTDARNVLAEALANLAALRR